MPTRRPLLLLATLVLVAYAAAAMGALSLAIVAEPGTTETTLGEYQIRIETSDTVIVSLSVQDGVVVGEVEPATGVRAATVRITIVGDPDQVIFEGKVTTTVELVQLFFAQETGRGEQ